MWPRWRPLARGEHHRPGLPAHHDDADADTIADTAEGGDRWPTCAAVEAECAARSGRPATTRVGAPVSGRYTSSPMPAPPASHEDSVGVTCTALRASAGNG